MDRTSLQEEIHAILIYEKDTLRLWNMVHTRPSIRFIRTISLTASFAATLSGPPLTFIKMAGLVTPHLTSLARRQIPAARDVDSWKQSAKRLRDIAVTKRSTNLREQKNTSASLEPTKLPKKIEQPRSSTEMEKNILSAAMFGDEQTVRFLIASKVDIETRNASGNTALICAAWRANTGVIQQLLAAKADTESMDNDNWTALHAAATKGWGSVTAGLLAAKADVEARNKEGNTPCMLATAGGHQKVVSMLYKAGADLEARNYAEWTALAVAMSHCKEMIQPLREMGADWGYASTLIANKRVAHLWGIGGASQATNRQGNYRSSFSLEGFSGRIAMETLSKHVRHYFNSNKWVSTVLTKPHQEEICACLEHFVSDSSDSYGYEVIERVEARKPLIILGGSKEHLVSMLLCKDHLGRYQLILCNRGEGATGDTTKFYLIDSKHIYRQTIDDLRSVHKDIESFFKTLERFKLQQIDGFSQKLQTIGICAWSGSKGIFRVLCEWYTNRATGRDLYKQFLRFSARPKELEGYVTGPYEHDTSLLRKIERKAYSKPYQAIHLSKRALDKLEEMTSYGYKPQTAPRFLSRL